MLLPILVIIILISYLVTKIATKLYKNQIIYYFAIIQDLDLRIDIYLWV
jgi:hypothetical protein